MPLVTVAKVKRFPTPADKLACCYVGRRAWGWPQTPWANPYRLIGTTTYESNAEKLGHLLNDFLAYALAQPDVWWHGLWLACRHGELALACWCASGDAEATAPHCHAGILACELNRRFVDSHEGGGS